ncbi:L-fucose:H+ symporter permease [Mucilaginibacter aquatilis]|uniref:L-fucose:H+ symporter permease n=1 Tax=Mucilaginibacter aquatilis TaxID=1517760 RepID=A0A6I4IC32_9SPHI|nr:L-fucose:H+ symporter permease [Mucilaginibacter aquatilis]MVN92805.1 L-fucose:H+ symporter permease [Mucilaginibacter aquatilis]
MNKKNTLPIILLTTLFFLWGFAHNLDPILIPHLKRSFTLSNVQATLVDTAVYAAYFVMAIPAGLIMKRFGYKSAIVTGLVFFAIGCYLFIPAANTQQYSFFLIALFIIACGLATLETVANPFMTLLGSPETAAQRLNLAQSFNGFATMLAPAIGTELILIHSTPDEQLKLMPAAARKAALAAEAASVKGPYMALTIILVIIAVVFLFVKLPNVQAAENKSTSKRGFLSILRHRHLSWGIAAQFFYVGAQTCIISLFVLYAVSVANLTDREAGHLASICGLVFLAGRFIGTFLMKYISSNRLLGIYAIINTILCFGAIYLSGSYAIYTVIAISFFMSIMFPTIFALGIKDLGPERELGSSLIIMSIVGGAIVPRAFGYLSDASHDIRMGYYVPMVCFVIIALFAFRGHRVVVRTNEQSVNAIY